MAVEGRVNAQTEHVLMVGGEHAGSDDGAVGHAIADVDGSRGQYPRGSDLVVDGCVLAKVEEENVLVVAGRDDGL